ncbi:MAG TPA: hypothetical protein VM307_12130 [Egibacteraceae bacterium]|nr:hypothetical protein [Egibacteraceae bacterium]
MAEATVRVWLSTDRNTQHHAAAPADDTAQEWDGVTACGHSGPLRWVHGETVDRAKTCAACVAAVGRTPPLEGDHPGPV